MSGKTAYKNSWQTKNKDRINLVVDKGFKDTVRAEAEKVGMSLNGFIVSAINEKLGNIAEKEVEKI